MANERTVAAKPVIPPNPTDLEAAIRYRLHYTIAKDLKDINTEDLFQAVSLAVKDVAVDRLLESRRRFDERHPKRVYYLSLEFLPGRTLGNNLLNLGLYDACRQALQSLGADMDQVLNEEHDPGLGNGGLGRLAACLLDSMATEGIPGFGYGINYQFGLFRQTIENGWQVEKPDRWLSDSVYWQITRPEKAIPIPFGGQVVAGQDMKGRYHPRWVNTQSIQGVPHDMPIVGYGGETVNFLRLYSAQTGNRLPRAVSERRRGHGPAAAADPGIFFHGLRPARYRAWLSAPSSGLLRLFRQSRHPDERHPPHDRCGRADAASGG
jgi:starch phosphorylase